MNPKDFPLLSVYSDGNGGVVLDFNQSLIFGKSIEHIGIKIEDSFPFNISVENCVFWNMENTLSKKIKWTFLALKLIWR